MRTFFEIVLVLTIIGLSIACFVLYIDRGGKVVIEIPKMSGTVPDENDSNRDALASLVEKFGVAPEKIEGKSSVDLISEIEIAIHKAKFFEKMEPLTSEDMAKINDALEIYPDLISKIQKIDERAKSVSGRIAIILSAMD